MLCRSCPHKCGVDRTNTLGRCHAPSKITVARIAPHFYEEPVISGTRGSGTVFFAGCSLSCIFCQNKAISRRAVGEVLSEDALADRMLALAETGVHNLNLVTATHYTDSVARVLARIKHKLKIPVIWNSSGYESPQTLRLLAGLVDIYLPDLKYHSPALAKQYSGVEDYPKIAQEALLEMHRQVGVVKFDGDGLLSKGVVVRHLVLPGHREDSLAVLDDLAVILPVSDIRLSLMRQYTPDFAPEDAPKNLKRRLTSFEYDTVVKKALSLGFDGFLQEKDAADKIFTPDFSRKGIEHIRF